MSRLKKVTSFLRGGRTTSKYQSLDYVGGYTFSTGVAYGQLNQVLDLAASKPRHAKNLTQVAKYWLKVIESLDAEAETPQQPIGFVVNRREETEDDSTTSEE